MLNMDCQKLDVSPECCGNFPKTKILERLTARCDMKIQTFF
jgi:hypothetical protein